MAILEMEGFDWQNAPTNSAGALLALKWNGTTFPYTGSPVGGLTRATSLNGFGGASVNNTNNSGFICTPGGTYSTLIVGFRFQASSITAGNTPLLCRFLDGASTQVGLYIDTSKRIVMYRGTTATVVATGTTVLLIGGIYLIEFKVTFGNTGSYELRIDGVTEFSSGSADTTNTANNSATAVALDLGNVFTSVQYDDFHLLDDTGPAPNNNFLSIAGSPVIESLFVTTNNSVTFTPLSSTNASNVDETQIDGDTSYNSSATNGQVDTFNHGALTSTPALIYGTQVHGTMRKDDVTAQSGRTKMISGGTTSNGVTKALVDGVYITMADIYPTDPNTGLAWTGANVNATKIGYEHV